MQHGTKRRFDVLLTAQEAYPVLEAQFMQAQRDIIAGFRVFDPWTQLRSDAAQAIGTTWFDLIVETLNRGVRVTLILSDFDPVVRQSMHAYTWSCKRALIAAGEASNNPDLLSVRASMHPARVGFLPRLVLWPRSTKEIRDKLVDINAGSRALKEDYLAATPYLRPMLKWRGDDLVPRFIPPPLVPVTHHQKLAVFDEETLYIGGLDLNDRRYDTPAHLRSADETWHDTQVLVTGQVAQDAAAHLRSFEAVTYGAAPPATRHLLRTISAKRAFTLPYIAPRPVISELAQAHLDQIDRAERLIYFESQFFRDRTLATHLAERAARNPALTAIIILPAAPEEAAFEEETSSDVAYGEHLQVQAIKIARDGLGDRLFIGSPAQPRPAESGGRAAHYGAPLVYLHAKVSIFDERCGIVSSANLNGRSMAWDTEAGVQTQGSDEVRLLKTRCFDHWLGRVAEPAFYDVETASARWSQRAADNATRSPLERTGFLLPYDMTPATRVAYNLPGVPEEMA